MPKRQRRMKRKTASRSVSKKQSIDQMKYEIANEFGVKLGANASSRDNGKVGGEMTKRLVGKSHSSKTKKSK